MVHVHSKFEKFKKIDQLKALVDEFRPFDVAIASALKQRDNAWFTYHSNAIEGNTLTQSETALVLTQGITVGGKTLDEHLEVIGHKDAIDYILALSQVNAALQEWEIKQMHHLMLRKIHPHEAGRYRTATGIAAGTNSCCSSHISLPQLMGEFVDWLNSAAALALHPVEYATLAHSRLLSIQPFQNGNGCAGRLLMNLLLLRAGYPIAVIPSQARNDYLDALAYGQHRGDLEPLLMLVCEAVTQSLVELLKVLTTTDSGRSKGKNFSQEMLAFMVELGEF